MKYEDITRRIIAAAIVNDFIMVELKAFSKIEDSHINQTLNYLEAFNTEIGLLINFGAKSLEFHRLTNKKFKPVNLTISQIQ